MSLELVDLADVITDAIQAEVEPLRAQLLATKQQAEIEIAALKSELAMVKAATPDSFRLRSIVVDMASEEVSKLLPAHVSVDAIDMEPITKMMAEQIAPFVTAKDVEAMVDKAIAVLPKPLDGQPGEPGRSVDPSDVEAMVTRAVSALPKPQDGKSITSDDVAPLIASEVHKAVSSLPVPKDGAGVVGAFVDRDGHLIVTLSDGATKDVGVVVGRDGSEVDIAVVTRHLDAELAKWPRPKDGTDGLGFDDFEEEIEDGGRILIHRYRSGDRVKEFRHVTAMMIHRKLYEAGKIYQRGDVVLWNNSSWTAIEDTKAEPGAAPAASRAWVLVARKGDVGKSGPKGGTGDRGPQGSEGPQGRQGY